MGHRLSKIYTRTGDAGDTGLGDGSRTPKDSARIEAIGTVDELNSALGLLRAQPELPGDIDRAVIEIQHDLFDLGGELCLPGHEAVTTDRIDWLEQTLDDLNADLPPLKEFILPGGSPAAAHAHQARALCRRAERRVVTLNRTEPVRAPVLAYLNRLSDLLFVIARTLARREGTEVSWQKSRFRSP